jgi:thiol:disulfide interchange protein DsbD
VCYPPLTQEETLTLAAAESASAPAKSAGVKSLSGLAKLIEGGGENIAGGQEFLEPDKAFVMRVDAVDGNTLRARFEIAEGYYLYRDKTTFESATPGVSVGPYALPEGERKVDEFFGETEVYHNGFVVDIPLVRGSAQAQTLQLKAGYQGCAEAGICYPPINKTVSLHLPDGAAGQAAAPAAAPEPAPAPAEDLSEEQRVSAMLADRSAWLTIGFFFLAGLGLAFTPCVFPMIPILSGIIAGQGAGITTRKAFSLSLVYVLAMAATYTVAGVIAALFGQNLQAAFQNPWILGVFAAIFVALSLSMFGFYELQLPSAVQSKLTEVSNRQEGGTLIGVAIMGVLSALIVGPCVAAPLAGALIYIGQSGDVVLGGGALFAMALGMGVPLLAVGTSAGSLMPRAGGWMSAVKAVFGVLLLGVAVWMLARILPPQISLVLYALLLIIPAIYLRAIDPLPDGATGWSRLWKGVGVVLLVYGLMLMLGAFTGARDPLDPLAGIQRIAAGPAGSGSVAAAHELEFIDVKGGEELDAALTEAAASGKPVMLDFFADWCIECVRMENTTFKDPGVQAGLSDYVLLRADVTPNDEQDQALLKRFGLFGPPALLFFSIDGSELRAQRFIGYMDADDFRDHIVSTTALAKR